ncbi:hypothetical protein NEPAR06_0793 [Nematocida parisii]|nr:hypothetical protein NEPAR04_1406 [Nematocida parisii]KAI5143942.1 hypothetical protein NEPAR07_0939 [Nematocida parisii]KAI5154011.1 hypothetical protein NEPAR06_0793 [Nematocida parisii]KAI5156826.1 hypothetical protein NEPAR05_0822 [Nematocida parisii]
MPDIFSAYQGIANELRNLILLSGDYTNAFNFIGIRSIYKGKNPSEKSMN